jgi:hypothetical protein
MELIVQILGFGSAWWLRPGSDKCDPERYTRRAAYFNSTAVRQGRKLHMAGPVHGLVRFNVSSGLNLQSTQRNIGQVFRCNPLERYGETNRLLALGIADDRAIPTHFLACMSGPVHGNLLFPNNSGGNDVRLISMSRYRGKQESLLLVQRGSYLSTTAGTWDAFQEGKALPRLRLLDEPESVIGER